MNWCHRHNYPADNCFECEQEHPALRVDRGRSSGQLAENTSSGARFLDFACGFLAGVCAATLLFSILSALVK